MLRKFNERVALWTVANVGTMGCAYIFAIIALVALPQAIGDSTQGGFHPLPLVTWLSQSFLQLVLLAIIMTGQDVQAKVTQGRDDVQFHAVMEMLATIRTDHVATQEILRDAHNEDKVLHQLMQELKAQHVELTGHVLGAIKPPL